MKKIGLLSDTHSWLDPALNEHFKEVDEIWHAGDVGDFSVIEQLKSFKPIIRGVYGNIDGREVRNEFPLHNRFTLEGLDIWITHIGGYPGRYNQNLLPIFKQHPPDIFICGHSHILKVIRDKKYGNMLTINPGAAGIHGFHKMRTAIRFKIENKKIFDMEVIELGLRGSLTH